MIRDAQRGWLTVALENGDVIPVPRTEEYSGRFNVRVPRLVHRALVEAAGAEGVSLNLFVASVLSRAVGLPNPASSKAGRTRKHDDDR